MISHRYKRVILIAILASSVLLSGCQETGNTVQTEGDRLRPLPKSAQILFLSNEDTGTGRMEIYSMDAGGGNITRITATNEQHYVFGIDTSRRYIVATRGSEDRKRLWLLDLQTGKETPVNRRGR